MYNSVVCQNRLDSFKEASKLCISNLKSIFFVVIQRDNSFNKLSFSLLMEKSIGIYIFLFLFITNNLSYAYLKKIKIQLIEIDVSLTLIL